jgi:MFS family permease
VAEGARSLWPEGGLWRHRDFLRLWAAQIVSAFGSRITRTALPVIAVLSLSGTADELALLAVLTYAPGVAVGLIAGGWVDRHRKRPILIGADLVRALAVASLPIASFVGAIRVVHVYAVAIIVGAASALFAMADGAFLPSLVSKEHVVEGNAKQQATDSMAEVAGPAVAGVLIQIFGAPLTVLIDALTYVWSAAFVGAIAKTEEVAPAQAEPLHVWSDARFGLEASFRHPIVRPLALASGAIALSGGFFSALYMLYGLSILGLEPAVIGPIVGAGGIGMLLGVAAARRVPRQLGLGRTLLMSLVLFALTTLFIPLAGSQWVPAGATIPLLVAHQLLSDGALMVYTIQAISLRQTVLPTEILGRVNGALAALSGALLPVGALVAGPLAEAIGVRGALVVGLGLGMAAPVIVAFSNVARLDAMPQPVRGPAPPRLTSIL